MTTPDGFARRGLTALQGTSAAQAERRARRQAEDEAIWGKVASALDPTAHRVQPRILAASASADGWGRCSCTRAVLIVRQGHGLNV